MLVNKKDLPRCSCEQGGRSFLFIAAVNKLVRGILLAWESKRVVADVAAMKLRDVDVCPDEGNFNLQVDGSTRLLVDERLDELHSLATLFQLQCQKIALLVGADAVVVGVGLKLEVARILVLLVRLGIKKRHGLLLLVYQIVILPVVPRQIAAFHEFALVAFVPDGAISLVESDQIHFIVERAALRPKHHLERSVEHLASLTSVAILCIGTYAAQ